MAEVVEAGRWQVTRYRDGWYVEDRGTDLVPEAGQASVLARALDDLFGGGVPTPEPVRMCAVHGQAMWSSGDYCQFHVPFPDADDTFDCVAEPTGRGGTG